MSNPETKSAVDHPAHYNSGTIEVIDFIEDWGLNFHLGNAIKYLARFQFKHDDLKKQIEDLKKALWYMNRYLAFFDSQSLAPPRSGQILVSDFCMEHKLPTELCDVIMLTCFASNAIAVSVPRNMLAAIIKLERFIDSLLGKNNEV